MAARCALRRDLAAPTYLWTSPIAGRACLPMCRKKSSTRSSPPRPWEKVRAWAWMRCRASFANTTATSGCNLSPDIPYLLFAFLKLRPKRTNFAYLYSSGPDSRRKAQNQRLRRMFEDRRHLGASAPVQNMRPRGLLRYIEEQARDQAFPRHRPRDYPVVGTR